MNILMVTNTYKPLLGGLEKSVESFATEFRKRGHRVIIVVPEYEGMVPEEDVVRIPAFKNFNGTDFSIQLPIPGVLSEMLENFKPDIVHSQHPFLVGDTALKIASKFNIPLVFTHHSLYEENVHYIPGNEKALKQFVIELSTGYANLADQVFAPSQSVEKLIKERGVESPIAVVPTGIYVKQFTRGAGKSFRKKHNIPADAFVVGHLGRLAPEKNLEFVSKAVFQFLKTNPKAHFMIAGKGPLEETIQKLAIDEAVQDRLHMVGILAGKDKVDGYHAMDVFAFASQSETQGLVLTEALACKVPIVAIDAPGVREVLTDQVNGRLLAQENIEEFVAALKWVSELSAADLAKVRKECRRIALTFSMDLMVERALSHYSSLAVRHGFIRRPSEESRWAQTLRMMQTQGNLVKNLTKAASVLISNTLQKESPSESV